MRIVRPVAGEVVFDGYREAARFIAAYTGVDSGGVTYNALVKMIPGYDTLTTTGDFELALACAIRLVAARNGVTLP